MIVHDTHSAAAEAGRQELEKRLPGGVEGIVVVIGGDGFLLQTASNLGFDRTYLGFNTGNLGFLLNDIDDWDSTVERLSRRAWTAYDFPLVEAKITLESDEVLTDRALNDVYLERMTGQTASLKLSIDGHCVVERLVADGIIFSTAIGSTAYGFSAGGPACHPALRTMSVIPICPHLPRLPAMVLPDTARATVEVRSPAKRPVRAVCDGREASHVKCVEVGLGPSEAHLAWLEGHSFTERLVRKLLQHT